MHPSEEVKYMNTDLRKVGNLPITKQDFVPGIFKHSPITPDCTSKRKLSVKANPKPKQRKSPVLSGRKHKEGLRND